MSPDMTELVTVAKAFLATRPVFRLRPVGAPGSAIRQIQDDQIAAEDALRRVIAKAEGRA